MVTAVFHGSLAKKFGREHKFAAPTVFLLIKGLALELGDKFNEHIEKHKWHIVAGPSKNASYLADASNALEPEQVHQQLGTTNEVHFYPFVAGKSNVARIIIGAVLIVAGVYFNQPWMVKMGATLVLSGVSGMLASVPTALQTSSASPSYFFNSQQNVTQQGGPVPVVFGRVRRAGSVVISQGSTAAKLTPTPVVLATSAGFAASYDTTASTVSPYDAASSLYVASNGYWSINTGEGPVSTGKYCTNPADGVGKACEMYVTVTVTSPGNISGLSPAISGPVGVWTPLTDDQTVVIDGGSLTNGETATVTVAATIRQIGTTTPTCTGSTTFTVGWYFVSGGA